MQRRENFSRGPVSSKISRENNAVSREIKISEQTIYIGMVFCGIDFGALQISIILYIEIDYHA